MEEIHGEMNAMADMFVAYHCIACIDELLNQENDL